MHRLSLIQLLIACLLLSGCGSLLESNEPPQSVWWLEPPQLDPMPPTDAGLVLKLTVIPGLDTDRILNLNDNARLNHYAGAHWPDHLPEFLGSLLARSLDATGRGPVRSGEYAQDTECLLELEVRRFQAHVDDAAVTTRVEFALAGSYRCPDFSRRLSVYREVPAGDSRMRSIVAAFQAAVDQGMGDLAAQLAPPG